MTCEKCCLTRQEKYQQENNTNNTKNGGVRVKESIDTLHLHNSTTWSYLKSKAISI